MTQQARGPRVHERWAHLRFSVIGQLLAAPPPKGELRAEIEALAARQWRHPTTGEPVRFGFSTIERWYYRALKERRDPGRRAAPQGARRCRSAARDERRRAAGRAGAIRRAQELERPAASRQPRRSGRDQARSASPCRPTRRCAASEGQRSRQAASRHVTPDRRRRPRRGAARRPRDPQLRGRVRQRPVALGLSPWLAEGAHRARRVADADPVRRARRSLAPRLSSAVVSGRDRRDHRPRPEPGVPEARPAALRR